MICEECGSPCIIQLTMFSYIEEVICINKSKCGFVGLWGTTTEKFILTYKNPTNP